MLTAYVHGAMHRTTYERLRDGTFYGEIPEFQGVWGNGQTLEACRADLRDALEGWIVLGLRHDDPFPTVNGSNLSMPLMEEPVQV